MFDDDDLEGQDSDLGQDLAMAATDNEGFDDFSELNFSPNEESAGFSELPSDAIAESPAEVFPDSQDFFDLSMDDDLDSDLNFAEEEAINPVGTDNKGILEEDDDEDDPQMDLLAGGLGFDENLLLSPTDDARRASVNTDIDLLEEEDTVLTDTSLSSTRNQFGEAMDLINENPFDQSAPDPDQNTDEDLSHWDDWSVDEDGSILDLTTEDGGLDDLNGAFDTWSDQGDLLPGDSLPSEVEPLGQEDFDLETAESLALEGMDSGDLDPDQDDDDLLSLGVMKASSDGPIADHSDIFDLSSHEDNEIEASVLENINNLDFSLEDDALFEEEELEEMFSDVSGDLSLSSSLEQFDDDDAVSNLNLDDDDLFKGMAVVKPIEQRSKNPDHDS
ncbi:MAG: hypothetical protein HC796_06835 [Synechococcaceae cyanobacterium RL_1_2]|nr:hypothetical protein [Synechococcaceae cyanobacterium RL_1_2]